MKRRKVSRTSANTSEHGWTKAELPADFVPAKKPEEADSREVCELPGSFPTPPEPSVHEFPANETPAHEVPASEEPPIYDEVIGNTASPSTAEGQVGQVGRENETR